MGENKVGFSHDEHNLYAIIPIEIVRDVTKKIVIETREEDGMIYVRYFLVDKGEYGNEV